MTNYDVGQKLEQHQTQFESGLSSVAWIPIVPGGVKAAYGIAQLIASLAVGIFAGARDALTNKKDDLCAYAFKVQVPHALANIGIGILEAIPFVGAGICAAREIKMLKNNLFFNYGTP